MNIYKITEASDYLGVSIDDMQKIVDANQKLVNEDK